MHQACRIDNHYDVSLPALAGASQLQRKQGDGLTLLLIDEAHLTYAPGVADNMWRNLKALSTAIDKDNSGASGRRNVRVVLFTLRGDGVSGLPNPGDEKYLPTPMSLSHIRKVEFGQQDGDEPGHDITLSLSNPEFNDLVRRWIQYHSFQDLFSDECWPKLYTVTAGHVSVRFKHAFTYSIL
jgi:hypothetical protein